MTANPIRTYVVTNPSALFAPGCRIVFDSSRPAGSIVPREIDGRPVRVLLTGIPLDSGVLGAELQITYL